MRQGWREDAARDASAFSYRLMSGKKQPVSPVKRDKEDTPQPSMRGRRMPAAALE